MSWELTGNSATNPNEHFLGTTDAQAFLIRVNRNRALRIDPQTTPNLIGGHEDNEVSQDVAGATIGGGGRDNFANRITASFGTIGGGLGNIVSGDRATVAGGTGNRAGALGAAIGGGGNNEASQNYAAIAGGLENRATGIGATVPGGERNSARGDYAFAAGRNAQADHAGSFVWADALGGDFASTGEQQFLIRASGGVGIGTNQPQAQLDVNGNLRVATEIIEGGAPLRTKYQPAGDYLTRSGGAITGNLQVSGVITEQNVALADKYQAKGNYQPAGSYITTGGGTITGHLNVGSLTVAQPSLSVGGLINLSRTTADGGYLETKLANGKAAIILSTSSSTGGGHLSTRRSNGKVNAALSSGLWIYAPNDKAVATVGTDNKNNGWLEASYTNGKRAVLATVTDDQKNGYFSISNSAGKRTLQATSALWLYNKDERAVVTVSTTTSEGGFLQTSLPNGKPAVRLTTAGSGANEAGYLAIYDKAGNARHVFNGTTATKHFVMPHPRDASLDIIYAAIEGPEAAAYYRGRATLQNGQATVALPEHFALIVNPETVTIQLTPRSAESKGLAVTTQSEAEFQVRELDNGTGAYEFDYFVAGVRRGLEEYQPVVPKGASAFADVVQPDSLMAADGMADGSFEPPLPGEARSVEADAAPRG